MSENKLFNVLQEMYPDGEIMLTRDENDNCDMILKREGKKDILIENKNYKLNVPSQEIKKFIDNVRKQNENDIKDVHGLLISQSTGIAKKMNYQIDFTGKNILMYVHNCNYDKDKLRTAIDMIDHLGLKINELDSGKNTFNIPNEVIDKINDEYQLFANKKKTLKKYIQEILNKLTDEIQNLELPSLSHLLNTKYSTVINDELICKNCNMYTARSKVGLSLHHRTCKPKPPTPPDNESDKSISSESSDNTSTNNKKKTGKKIVQTL